jgi:hypothetical protein
MEGRNVISALNMAFIKIKLSNLKVISGSMQI